MGRSHRDSLCGRQGPVWPPRRAGDGSSLRSPKSDWLDDLPLRRTWADITVVRAQGGGGNSRADPLATSKALAVAHRPHPQGRGGEGRE